MFRLWLVIRLPPDLLYHEDDFVSAFYEHSLLTSSCQVP